MRPLAVRRIVAGAGAAPTLHRAMSGAGVGPAAALTPEPNSCLALTGGAGAGPMGLK